MKRTISGIILTLLLMSISTVAINIKPVKSTWTGTVYIRADGSIDPPDAPIITYDKITYTLTGNITSSDAGIVVERDNIILDGAGYIIQGTGLLSDEGVYLSGRSNVTIKNAMITNFYSGISLKDSSNNVISGNNIKGNNDAIRFFNSSNNIIVRNIVTDNDDGIMLQDSSNSNIVSGNVITRNYDPLGLYGSSNNTISGNIVTNNDYGIGIYWSFNNIISENTVSNNEFGMRLAYSSFNIISGNTITSNYEGILFGYSLNNEIFHNNFINNLLQAGGIESINIWDDGYPSGGNYWSDYIDVDLFSGPYQNETGSDGIGDTQYSIDYDNVDRYPLMHPWSPIPVKVFNVVYEDVHYPVSINSNSSITHFIFNQSLAQISFKLTGDAGKTGYCNITIPKSLMRGPWDYTFEGNVLDVEIFEDENETHTILSFTYKHASTFKITIQATWVIQEFPHTTTLPLIIITSTLAILLKRRKQNSRNKE